MKYNITFACLVAGLAASQLSRAQTTAIADDLQLELVFSGKASPKPSPGGRIDCYLTGVTSNRTVAVYEPESSYFYRAELFDTNGVAVPKTELGQTKGSRFADLDSEVGLNKSRITFEPREFGRRGVRLLFNGNRITAYKSTFSSEGVARCSGPPAPLELFSVSSTGEYRLRLTFQVFELVGDKATKLVRFPTIEEKIIVKPEDLSVKKSAAPPRGLSPSEPTPALAQVQPVPPLQVKSSKALNIKHLTLTFAGYGSPDAAFESWIWAFCRGDKANMLQSVSGEMKPY